MTDWPPDRVGRGRSDGRSDGRSSTLRAKGSDFDDKRCPSFFSIPRTRVRPHAIPRDTRAPETQPDKQLAPSPDEISADKLGNDLGVYRFGRPDRVIAGGGRSEVFPEFGGKSSDSDEHRAQVFVRQASREAPNRLPHEPMRMRHPCSSKAERPIWPSTGRIRSMRRRNRSNSAECGPNVPCLVNFDEHRPSWPENKIKRRSKENNIGPESA